METETSTTDKAGNGIKPVVHRSPNFIEEILHGKAPLHNATVSERDVIRGLSHAIDFSIKIPNGNMLTGQLCEVANLLWEWHDKMQKAGLQ